LPPPIGTPTPKPELPIPAVVPASPLPENSTELPIVPSATDPKHPLPLPPLPQPKLQGPS
jgi:hypothetical protein